MDPGGAGRPLQARGRRAATRTWDAARDSRSVRLAQAFPNSTFVGYDAFEGSIAGAEELAAKEGVADRVRFEVRDVGEGLDEKFDVISTFDVIHDAVDPVGLLKGIRSGLADDGHYLLPRHQLRGRSGRQPGAAGRAVLRVQRHVLHDHVAGERRRGPRHLRPAACEGEGADSGGRVLELREAAARESVQQSVRRDARRGEGEGGRSARAPARCPGLYGVTDDSESVTNT